MRRIRPAHLALLLPLLPILLFAGNFFYISAEAQYSDLTISHYPNLLYLARALREWHTVPLWSPAILSGFPFAANPLSGLWYPPGWLAILLPPPIGFNLVVALHLLWGGMGLYLLLRMQKLSRPAALLGALAFASLPKLFAHFGAGHLTLVYAVPWTPWLLLAQLSLSPKGRGGGDSVAGGEGEKPGILLQPGLVLALIFLADVRWAAYAGVLWLAWSLAHSQISRRAWRASLGHWSRQTGGQILLAGLLAAPLALPLAEFARLSTRAALSADDSMAHSLPLPRLLGLFFPDFGGSHEWVLYAGAVLLVVCFVGMGWSKVRRRAKFWFWAAGLTLLFSLGENLPFLPALMQLPGLNLLRVPPRALFIMGMALAVFAAHTTDALLAGPSPEMRRRANLLLTVVLGSALTLAGGLWALAGKLPLNFAWGVGLAVLAAVWLLLGLWPRMPRPMWAFVFIGLCLLDAGGTNIIRLAPRPAVETLAQGEQTARFLAAQDGIFRVYSPSYSLPQHTAARYGLELADGVDPMQIAAYTTFMASATGVPSTGYSTTLPPMRGHLHEANADYLPDPARLGLLNVRFVVAEYDLMVDGLTLREQFGETRVYENLHTQPRAWVQDAAENPGVGARAVSLAWSPNRLALRAEGPGVLVVSALEYPGWLAVLDGQPAEILPVAGILRGVALTPGEHDIIFEFQPVSVYAGLALFGVGVVVLLWRRK